MWWKISAPHSASLWNFPVEKFLPLSNGTGLAQLAPRFLLGLEVEAVGSPHLGVAAFRCQYFWTVVYFISFFVVPFGRYRFY